MKDILQKAGELELLISIKREEGADTTALSNLHRALSEFMAPYYEQHLFF